MKILYFGIADVLLFIFSLSLSSQAFAKGGDLASENKQTPTNLVIVTSDSDNRFTVQAQLSDGSGVGPLIFERSLEYKHSEDFPENLLLNGEVFESGQHAHFIGICHTAKPELAFIVSQWGETTLNPSIVAYKYDHHNESLSKVVIASYGVSHWSPEEGENEGESELFECAEGENTKIKSGKFASCLCRLELVEELNDLEADISSVLHVPRSLFIGSSEENNLKDGRFYEAQSVVVSDEKVSDILKKIESARDMPFTVEKLHGDNLEVISIVYEQPIYDSFSALLMRKNASSDWQLVYGTWPSSKGFHTAELRRINEDGTLQVGMCLDGCDWWGNNFGVVDIGIEPETGKVSFDVLREEDPPEY